MPRNGSGDYSLPTNSWNPAINGVSATPADWQALVNDMAAALQASVASDGQTPMTGDLAMGGYRLTGAGAPSGAGMSLRWEQLIQGADIPSATTVTIPLEGSYFSITGATAITSLAATVAGRLVFLKFAAGIVLTNSASLILPNSANITTQAGQVFAFVCESTGWRLVGGTGLQALNPGQNSLINSNFAINQLAVSGTVTLAAGAYGHDMWKAGASGCTYTFATVANVTTLNITAGSLRQIIEGTNLQSGTYTLSWGGTAQGRVDSGAYGASGLTGTAVGGTNQTVEFGVGTLSKVKYEAGSVATPWCGYNGIYGGDNEAVLRYAEKSYDDTVAPGTATTLGAVAFFSSSSVVGGTLINVGFKVKKAATPTITTFSPFNGAPGYMYDNTAAANRAAEVIFTGKSGCVIRNSVTTTLGATHNVHWLSEARL